MCLLFVLTSPFQSRWSAADGEEHDCFLTENDVMVALGIKEIWDARNVRFHLAWVRTFLSLVDLPLKPLWAALEADGVLSKADALALASINLGKLLADSLQGDLVVTRSGDLLEFRKVAAVVNFT